MDLKEIQGKLRRFAAERDWERFHSPKNLSMALSVEAAELLEHFQWVSEDESSISAEVDREAVAQEIADVQIYLAMLADRLEIDIELAVEEKIRQNALKYPPTTEKASSDE